MKKDRCNEMTINDLLKRLYEEKGENGVWNVLKSNYNDLEKLCKARDLEKDSTNMINLEYRVNEKYAEINGFIWGLCATDYIGTKESTELFDELLDKVSRSEKAEKDSLDNVISSAEKRSRKVIKDNNVFEYGGYHFLPVGIVDKSKPLEYIARNTISDKSLGMWSNGYADIYGKNKINYKHSEFYKACKDMPCDIFKCLENGKVYLPAENELFVYTGKYKPYAENREERQSEVR